MRPTVRDIRRFPVKSTGGERLENARVDKRGLVGDRGWAIYDADEKMASGKNTRRLRRMDPVFDVTSRMVDGARVPQIQVGSSPWLDAGSVDADDVVSAHMGQPVHLKPERDIAHFDDGQVSLLGTASLTALGALSNEGPVDARHFRTNLLLDTIEPWVEESWTGRTLRIGDVVLRVVGQVERCRTINLAQDGAKANRRLLKTVGVHRNMRLGVYADVVDPGTLQLGDEIIVDFT